MENKTKLILTALGIAAILVPAVLLIVFSKKDNGGNLDVQPAGGVRQLRQDTIQNEVENAKPSPVLASPTVSPSPVQIQPTNSPIEASGSGGPN